MSARPDAVAGLAAYLEREGVSSARIDSVTTSPTGGWAAAECTAGDGSRWWIATDAYGTAYGWAETMPDALAQVVAELKRRAAEPAGWMARADLAADPMSDAPR